MLAPSPGILSGQLPLILGNDGSSVSSRGLTKRASSDSGSSVSLTSGVLPYNPIDYWAGYDAKEQPQVARRKTSLDQEGFQHAEAIGNSTADQDESRSSSSPRSPSTEVTDVTMSDALGSGDDSSVEGTPGSDVSITNPDERLLNPTSYFNKLKSLRSTVFQNSAVRYYKHSANQNASEVPTSTAAPPTTEGQVEIPSGIAALPVAQMRRSNLRLRIPFRENEWFEKDLGDDFWLKICSRTSSQQVFDLLECRNLMASICSSLKVLQKAGFCSNRFSILALDKSRPTVAMLLPIEIASIEKLMRLFVTTLTASGDFALSSSAGLETSCPQGAYLTYDCSSAGNSSPHSSLQSPNYEGRTGGKDGSGYNYSLSEVLTTSCLDLLAQLQLEPDGNIAPESIWRSTVHFLDLAVLSYVGAHTESIGETYLQTPMRSFSVPGPFTSGRGQPAANCASENFICMRRRKLQCLDQFLGQKEAWVFYSGTDNLSDLRLCLSADAETLADIWGPLWKTKSDPSSREVAQYNIGNGFIVPWERSPHTDPQPRSDLARRTEVFCHWISSRDWDKTLVEQHQLGLLSKHFLETDILLIGADVLAVNANCNMTLHRKLKIKQDLNNNGNLRHRGTRRSRREKDSQSYQVQASAMGFATVGSTVSYKRSDGLNMKDALIERWRNGARNIKFLEFWGGVEVSLCTQNARRRQLLHLLRCSGMRKYLRAISFKWDDKDCESEYFKALDDPRKFRKFWIEHPKWQKNIGDAINECFSALEETGVDERSDELSVFWIEIFDELDNGESDDEGPGDDGSDDDFASAEEHLLLLRRSEHSWTGFLRDSPECLTMAIVDDNCLDFNDAEGYGMRCQAPLLSKNSVGTKRSSPGYSVLQTALLINKELLNSEGLQYKLPDRKRKHAPCGDTWAHVGLKGANCYERPQHHEDLNSSKGYWNITSLKKRSKFSLGTHGYLTVYRLPAAPCDPLLMEWEPLLNTLSKEMKTEFNERALGKSGDKHHSEYIGGAFLFSPMPCLIISKTIKQRRK